jgi:hypothetical protein
VLFVITVFRNYKVSSELFVKERDSVNSEPEKNERKKKVFAFFFFAARTLAGYMTLWFLFKSLLVTHS